MLHEVMHANKAIFGLSFIIFGATLLSNCQLPPSFVCPCVSLCLILCAKNDYAIYQPLCHCYATVISLCCLSAEN